MRLFSGSLQRRIIVSIASVIGVSMAATSFFQLRSAERRTWQQASDQASEIATTLEASLRHSMLNADAEGIEKMLTGVAGRGEIERISILNAEGAVGKSSDAALVGSRQSSDEPKKALAGGGSSAALTRDASGKPMMHAVSVVKLEQACLQCHDSSKAGDPAGYIVLERSVVKETKELRAAQVQVIGMNLALAAILIAALVFVARKITHPLKEITRAAEGIAQGDLDQNITHRSDDELGALAESFRNLCRYLGGMAKAAEAMGKGDLSADLAQKSDRDVLARNFSKALASLRSLVTEIKGTTDNAQGGDLAARADASKFDGGYRDIVHGINATLDAVVTPIREAASVLENVADRDLSSRMKGEYRGEYAKLKESLNATAENLDQALQQVSVAVDQVASAASQIGTGSQSLAQGASEQASSLEQVSSSLQELASMTRQNVGNAKEARSLAEGTRAKANKGVESMQRLSEAMEKIKGSSDSTAKIVKTIDEIAFQTNLLALNAAVEAARAGDAGKGFAVVAEEVRNLAMRSAEAAKNTANMIEESVHNAEAGVELNQEVFERLQEITNEANKVGDVMGEIAVASEQQSQGIEQITGAVDQVNQVTQQTAANSEESASASEELSGQSEELKSLVSSFRLSGGAGVRTNAMRTASRPGSQTTHSPKLELVQRRSAVNPASVIPFPEDEQDAAVLGSF